MSEYWQGEENPHISRRHWASGFEKDADYELSERNTLTELRIISSRLSKNNFLSHGIILSILNAVLGGNVNIKVSYPNDTLELSINELLNKSFSGVDEEAEVPIEEFLEMVTTGATEKGDILINLFDDENKDCGFSLELIEANRIRTPNELLTDVNVIEGVRYSGNRVKSFYVRKLCPHIYDLTAYQDNLDNFEEIPKYKEIKSLNGKKEYKRLCYLFRCPSDRRPNQTRGIPTLTSVMGILRYISQYFEALLISMRVSACFCGIMTTKNVPGTKDNLSEKSIENMFQTFAIEPGSIMITEEGTITFSTPNKPSDNVKEMLKFFCMLIGMSLRIPYPYLFLDFEQVNYSSYRGAGLEMKRVTKRWHNRFEWVVKWLVLEMLKVYKMKNLLNFSLSKCEIILTFPEFEALDQEKTARGEKLDLVNSTTSPQKLCEKKGIVYSQIMKDKEKHALIETKIQAEVLKLQKRIMDAEGIIFPGTQVDPNEDQDDIQENSKLRPGEEVLDDEAKKERRKEDGNW